MVMLLGSKVGTLEKVLRNSGKQHLADCIAKNWEKSALAYSKELNFSRPSRVMEKELVDAFDRELERTGHTGAWREDVLESVKKRRVIQTGPHLGATESPRMLCVNWLGSLGVSNKDFYVVGMFSGIPFSNRSRPGRINRVHDSINLFPSSHQDGLVYRSLIPEKLVGAVDGLPRNVSQFFPHPVAGESYTKWALDTCEHIERKVIGKRNLTYIDINEVVTNYLLKVLRQPEHVFYKIFFNPKIQAEWKNAFPDEALFYAPVMSGKYEKMESVFLNGGSLKSKSLEIPLQSPERLFQALEHERLCPALLPTFLVLAFLNQFKCLGSFAQVEYLPVYQEKLANLSFMKNFKVNLVPTSNLTTGLFPEKRQAYALDMAVKGEKIVQSPDTPFGELLVHMRKVLLESYFIGDKRTTK